MSPSLGIIAVLSIGALGVGAYVYLRGRGPRRVRRLRALYLQMLHQPKGRAEETLLFRLENLSEKHPGRSMEWYLEWLLAELRRDLK